jgi:predicted nucleic acid-binding protein
VKRVFEILLTHQVIISRKVIMELEKYVATVNLLEFNNVILVNESDIQRSDALKIARERKVPFGDALHAILAKDNGAIVLTRDKHFLRLRDISAVELL